MLSSRSSTDERLAKRSRYWEVDDMTELQICIVEAIAKCGGRAHIDRISELVSVVCVALLSLLFVILVIYPSIVVEAC